MGFMGLNKWDRIIYFKAKERVFSTHIWIEIVWIFDFLKNDCNKVPRRYSFLSHPQKKVKSLLILFILRVLIKPWKEKKISMKLM